MVFFKRHARGTTPHSSTNRKKLREASRDRDRRRSRLARLMSRSPQVEALEDRRLLAVVGYDAGTNNLTLDADAGEADNVQVIGNSGADTLQLLVGNGDALTLAGDAVANADFVLSTTNTVDDTLTIDLSGSDVDGLTINAGDMDDVVDASSADGVIDTLIVINGGTGNDILIGSEFADQLNGNGGSDTINGLGGNDVIAGGGGTDILNGGTGDDTNSFADLGVGVVANLGSGSVSYQPAPGVTIFENFAGFANLQGSPFNDQLFGDGGANVLEGGDGDDLLSGGGGADQLFGNEGDDLLQGAGGSDLLDGGIGNNTADFRDINLKAADPSVAGVTADLQLGTASYLAGGILGNPTITDTLSDIQNLIGSENDDELLGDNDSNLIAGGAGDDLIDGRGGADFLRGDALGAGEAIQITVENLLPAGGTFLTPVWFGFHDGANFDLLDVGAPASQGVERLAEDGSVEGIAAEFNQQVGGAGVDATVAGFAGAPGPIDPGETTSFALDVDSNEVGQGFFTFLSMVIPSNDALLATADNPLSDPVFDLAGNFLGPVVIERSGSDVLDAGTEVNNELDAAFINQFARDTGLIEGGVVASHFGFNGSVGNPGGAPVNILAGITAAGTIIDPVDGDFTADNDLLLRITIDQVAGGDDLIISDGIDTIDGGTGNDTVDFGPAAAGIIVDLDVNSAGAAGTPSQDGGILNAPPGAVAVGGVVPLANILFEVDDIENVVGTAFPDGLFGNNEVNVLEGQGDDDVFHGFAADDFLSGGTGSNTVLFSAAPAPVNVNLDDQVSELDFFDIVDGLLPPIFAATGGAGNNVLSGFSSVVGSTSEDDFVVSPSATETFSVNGNDPSVTPGDELTVDLTGTTGASLTALGPGMGEITFTSGENPIMFSGIESLVPINGALVISPINLGANANDADLSTDGGDTVLTVDGNELIRVPTASITGPITINSEDDDDSLTVDFTGGNPVPAGGIAFNGGTQATGTGDSLSIIGSFTNQIITYDNTPSGDGFGGSLDLDGALVTFTGLEPVNAGDAVNTTLNLPAGLSNSATLRNSAVAGEIEIIDNGATFEDTVIPNPTGSLIVNLGDQGDTIEVLDLDAAFAVPLTVNGGDFIDTIFLLAVAAGVTANVNGGDANDEISIGAGSSLGSILGDVNVNGEANDALGTITIGISGDSNTLPNGDTLNLNDFGDAGTYAYTLDAATFSRTGTGTITYGTIESLVLLTSMGNADVDVASTAASATTSINSFNANSADTFDIASTGEDSNLIILSGGGEDQITIAGTGGDGADADTLGSFVLVDAGDGDDTISLQGADTDSRVSIQGDDPNTAPGDTLELDAGGGTLVLTPTGLSVPGLTFETMGIETFSVTNVGDVTVTGDANDNELEVFNGPAPGTMRLMLDGGPSVILPQVPVTFNGDDGNDTLAMDYTFGPVNIPVEFNGEGQPGIPGDQIELRGGNAQLVTHTFANANDGSIDIDFNGGGSDSLITYTGLEPVIDNLSAVDRVFTFVGGAETITLSEDATIGDGISVIDSTLGEIVFFLNPTGSLTVNAGSGADTVDVTSIDNGIFIPNLIINGGDEADTISLVNILPFEFGTITVNGDAGNDTILGSASVDTINGGDDNDTIIGNGGGDLLFGDAGEDMFIWNNGDGPDDVTGGDDEDSFTFNGADGPDDLLNISPGPGDGSLIGSEFNLTRFLPSFFSIEFSTLENATVSGLGGEDTFNIADLSGQPNLATLTLNGNDDDDIFNVALNTTVDIIIDGGAPVAPTLPGDQLNVTAPNELNIFSDKAGNVTLTSSIGGTPTAPLSYTSIETILALATNGEVNLIGDNNDVGVDQPDNFVVVGRDVDSLIPGGDADGANEAAIVINGNAPSIGVYSVTKLNALGDDSALTPSIDDDIDTLEITPYADDTPLGWGIDVFFDEGNPVGADGDQVDLLIYNTSAFGGEVSEDIVVRPSGPDAGELIVTNGSFGTPIVDIDYVGNTDIIVRDNDLFANDTDTLTLLGSNPDPANNLTGNDYINVDLTNNGDGALPIVRVLDLGPDGILNSPDTAEGAVAGDDILLYRLRTNPGVGALPFTFDTLNIDTLGGDDTISITGRNDGTATINVAGSAGNDTLRLTGTAGANDAYTIGDGSASVQLSGAAAATTINHTGIDAITIAGGGGAGTDTLNVSGNGANNTFTATGTPLAGTIGVDAGPVVTYGGFGTGTSVVNLDGQGGDDQVDYTLSGATDAVTYTPTASNGGQLMLGAAVGNVVLAGIETLNVDALEGAGDADALTIAMASATISSTGPESGVVTSNDVAGNALLSLNYSHFETAGIAAGSGIGVIQGTEGNDLITVAANGDVTVTDQFGNTNTFASAGFTNLVINSLGGDDTINITPSALIISVVGGDNGDGSDTLNFNGAGAAIAHSLTAGSLTETGLGAVSYTGVEHVNIDGGAQALTVTGTAGNDVLNVTPLGNGQNGRYTHDGSVGVDFNYSSSGSITFAGGAGTGDLLSILGDEAIDAITATANTITVDGSVVTIGTGLEALRLTTLGGDDNINLTGFTNGGNAMSVEIYGGIGNDTIRGSDLNDVIYGGAGNDILMGGIGNDTQHGEDGRDIFGNPGLASDGNADDPGTDFNFGGAGDDNFVWEPGDGTDFNQGGNDGADILRFFGNAGNNTITFQSGGTPTHFNALFGAAIIDNHGIEDVRVDPLGGNDTITINDLFATEVVNVTVLAGGGNETVNVAGRTTDDDVSITTPVAGVVDIEGLTYDVTLTGSATTDTLNFNAGDGNDSIEVGNGVQNQVISIISGDAGDDSITGWFTTANGGVGDDFIRGAANDQTINGGDGEDTLIGGAGADSFDGGAGFDTILIEGTTGADVIDVFQAAPTTLQHTVNGTLETDTLVVSTVEQASIVAGDGADVIRVNWLDAHGVNGADDALRMTVDGGDDSTSDRLAIVDNGTADLMLYRKGQDNDSGTVQIGPGNDEPLLTVFSGVENLDFVNGAGTAVDNAAGTTQLVVFKHDPFESNDDRFTATYLGSGDAINVDPNIDPGPFVPFGLAGDVDVYRLVAETTGTLDFQVYFRQVGAIGGRPGLPNSGNLDINVMDASGNVIAGFGVNDATDDERVRIPAVEGQTYYLQVSGAAGAINTYNISVINEAPATPFDLELLDNPVDGTTNPPGTAINSDTGRSQFDNVTYDTTPTIYFRLDDGAFLNDIQGNTPPLTNNPPNGVAIPIPFAAAAGTAGYRVAIFDEGNAPAPGTQTGTAPQTPIGFATQVPGQQGVYQFTSPVLSNGSHFLSARVQITDPSTATQTGFGPRSESLEIIVDSVVPPVSFGETAIVDDGLHPDSDTGNPNIIGTLSDNITSDLTPTFFGRAEANSIVRMYLDSNSNGIVDAGDLFLGQDVANPLDGTNQHPGGAWQITSTVGMNDPAVTAALGLLPTALDGVRPILVQAEDVAGNISPDSAATRLTIFVDTQGPQVTDVRITGSPAFDLFTLKPGNVAQGPTPRVDSITISVRDLPARIVPSLFQYAALSNVEDANSAISIIGDHSGIVPITSIVFTGDANVNNAAATGNIVLTFAEPLADDRFTLTVEDGLIDPVGNALDGESQGARPIGTIGGISGDNIPGGDFIARFTVDSRPEVGSISQGLIYVDINGNQVFDPEGQDNDAVNRDFVYQFGRISDGLFAGNFGPAGTAGSGFDKLAAYGALNSTSANPQYSFLFDTNDDGVGDVSTLSPFQVNAIPVAGNFNNSAADIAAVAAGGRASDEVALFDGQNWYVDFDGDFIPETQIAASYIGVPMVGDFNGDGVDDFAVYENDTNVVIFDTNRDGVEDSRFSFDRFPGLSGFTDKPVVGDLNLDGVDDFGIWVKGRDGVLPREAGEYFFWLSDNPLGAPAANASANFNPFSPDTLPGGNDLFTQWGDEFALPILGNFDPVLSDADPVIVPSSTNGNLSGDVNNDGSVTPLDALMVINALNSGKEGIDLSNRLRAEAVLGSGFFDVDGNDVLTPIDALRVINTLNNPNAGTSEPVSELSGEPVAQSSWQESVDVFFEDDDDDDDQASLDEAIGLMF